MLLGIKVDKGVQPLYGTDGETTVQVLIEKLVFKSSGAWVSTKYSFQLDGFPVL